MTNAQITEANREKLAGRRHAIEVFEHLKQCSPEFVFGFLQILQGSADEIKAAKGIED